MNDEQIKRFEDIVDELIDMVISTELDVHNGNMMLTAIDSMTEVIGNIK